MGTNEATEAFNMTDEFINSLMDPDGVTKNWVLVNNIIIVPSILAMYLLFVLKLGPSLMKHREGLRLKGVLRVYNLTQVVLNGYFVVLYLVYTNYGTNIVSIVHDYCSLEDVARRGRLHPMYSVVRVLPLMYWAGLSLKIFDLLDTVFMVLKKKDSHITFLHVYHHFIMVFFTWLTLKYYKTHHFGLGGIINLFVHAVMYSYFFLATFPRLKKYLWWKSHLTKLQLVQFVFLLMYFSYVYGRGCHIPRVFTYFWMFNVSTVAALFLNFYLQTYIRKDNNSKKD